MEMMTKGIHSCWSDDFKTSQFNKTGTGASDNKVPSYAVVCGLLGP